MLLTIIAAEATAAPNPIIPEVNELFWGAISFGTLYLAINFVLLPPLRRVMQLREATIRNDRDAADIAKAEAATAVADVDSQLVKVRKEAAGIIDQARVEAGEERQKIIARAEREVAAIKDQAEGELEGERAEALSAIRPQMADLAVGAASRVLNKPIDSSAAKTHIDRTLNGAG